MKTPGFQLYKRSRLRTRLRNLVALEAERQYAKSRRMPNLEAEMDEALQWQEREILDSVYPTVGKKLKPRKSRD